jgi:hypothetical protein
MRTPRNALGRGLKAGAEQFLSPNLDDQRHLKAEIQHSLARNKDFLEGYT